MQKRHPSPLSPYPHYRKDFIHLPDSSTVLLNEITTDYQESYGTALREVRLDGEAYFDIRPDRARAFIVHGASKHESAWHHSM